MPLYEYECDVCKQFMSDWRTVADRDDCPKCECGGTTKKIISAYRVHPDMEPYYDDNLQSYIKGKQHRKQVMREQGVEERIGQGWTTSAKKHRKVG